MPAETKSVDELSTQLFKKNFLEAGGLKFVINVLQKDVFPATIDPFVRQDCYAVALSLARFLLCVARTQTVPVRKRSSASQGERQASPVCTYVRTYIRACRVVVVPVFLVEFSHSILQGWSGGHGRPPKHLNSKTAKQDHQCGGRSS